MPPYSKFDIQDIIDLKAKGLNQSQIAAELGCSQANVSKLCGLYDIHWDKGAAARDQNGEKNPNFQGGMGKSTIERLTRSIMIREGRCLYTCERCGVFNKYQEHPRHHKDRDRSNNDPNNLEVLCVACHNMEHNQEKERDSATGRFLP